MENNQDTIYQNLNTRRLRLSLIPKVVMTKTFYYLFIEGAILTVIFKHPMANADIDNQDFIFSWLMSGVAGGGWQYYVD